MEGGKHENYFKNPINLKKLQKNSCKISEIGKTVFLEKEAAEKTLKEMEGKK